MYVDCESSNLASFPLGQSKDMDMDMDTSTGDTNLGEHLQVEGVPRLDITK